MVEARAGAAVEFRACSCRCHSWIAAAPTLRAVKRSILASDGLAATGVDREWLGAMLPRVDPSQVTVKEAPRWFRAIWAKGIVAVAMPWAIYMAPAMMDRYEAGAEPRRLGQLLVHELTHVEQFRRLGALRHIGQYSTDYVRGRARRLGHWEAYRAIRLEVEARAIADSVMEGPR